MHVAGPCWWILGYSAPRTNTYLTDPPNIDVARIYDWEGSGFFCQN